LINDRPRSSVWSEASTSDIYSKQHISITGSQLINSVANRAV